MNISEINKVEEIGHFEFVSENDLGKITKEGNKHFAVVKYKNTYSGDRKISERSMVIYFICVDNIVQKIGYTNADDGLSGATGLYGLGAMVVDPGQNRFCLHLEIYKLLKDNKKVNFYARWFDETIEAEVDGVFKKDGKEKIITLLNAVDTENFVKNKFENISKLPEWNLQEKNESYERKAKLLHGEYTLLPRPKIGPKADALFEKIKNYHKS